MSRPIPEISERLIDDYGDACFDCGEWQLDKNTDMPYETLFTAQQSAREALIEVHAGLLNVAEALLLFYTPEWTDERVDRWLALTGSAEATTKALCDFARRILAKAEAQ